MGPIQYYTSAVWQVAVLSAGFGLAFGILLPSIGPMVAKYADAVYPQESAQVQAAPLLGACLGTMTGQFIAAVLWDRFGQWFAWMFCGAGFIVATLLLVCGSLRICRSLERLPSTRNSRVSMRSRVSRI